MLGVLSEIHGLTASLAAATISTLGIFAVFSFGKAAVRHSAAFSAFAVGLLTVSVVFHLLPEALDRSDSAVAWVAGGFAVMVLIGIMVHAAVRHKPDGAALTFGYASIIALASHSFLDGAIYAAAFSGEAFTGWITALGLMAHEFPEGIIAFFLLAQAGVPPIRSAVMAFFAASITTLGGTLLANVGLGIGDGPPLTAMLGGAAGALIYVLIVHLIPHAASGVNGRGFLAAQLGVAVGVLAIIANSLNGHH